MIGFGAGDTAQNLDVLVLPSGAGHKEVLNSTWPEFRMNDEPRHYDGGHAARLVASDNLNLPSIGAVVLERRLPLTCADVMGEPLRDVFADVYLTAGSSVCDKKSRA